MPKKNIRIDIKAEELKKKLNIRDGKDGKNGLKGEKGDKGDKGDTPDVSNIVSEALKLAQVELESKIPTPIQIAEQIPVLGEKVRDSLELLQGEDRLDKNAIRGLDDYDEIAQLARKPKIVNKTIVKGGSAGGLQDLQSVTDIGSTTTNPIQTPTIQALTSAGGSIKSHSGSTVAEFGAGGGQNWTFYDGVKLDGGTASRVLLTDASKNITYSTLTSADLEAIPTMYVPYTGATSNVNLGSYELTTGQVNTPIIKNPSGNNVTFKNLLNTTIATIDSNGNVFAGILSAPVGSVSAPSYTFTGETNTGAYRIGSGIYGITTLGVERARFSATGMTFTTPSSSTGGIITANYTANTWTNSSLVQKILNGTVTLNQSGTAGFDIIDFSITQTAVGSGEKNLIRFNRSGSGVFTVNYQGAVTLNKSMPTTPVGMLDIVTVGTYADTVPAILAGKAVTSGNSLGASFRNLTGTTGNAMIEIAGIISGSPRVGHIRTDSAGNMSFHTGSTAYGTLGTQRLFIAQGGNVGIGTTTSIAYALQVDSTSTNQFAVRYNASNYLSTQVISTGGAILTPAGTSPYFQVQVGSAFFKQDQSGQFTFYNPSNYVVFQGDDTGSYIASNVYSNTESGLHSTNGDEYIATFDQDLYEFYYFQRSLYGSNTVINSLAQLKILNADGYQFQIGHDLDNLFMVDVASDGNVSFYANSLSITPRFYFNERVVFGKQAQLASFTVATLPSSPETGDIAYVTDALTPVWNATVVGGGSVKVLVQFDGSNWKVA